MQQYYLGIDGGGSKCKAVICDQDLTILGEGISGSANPYQNVERAKQSIISATEWALTDANLPITMIRNLIAGVGLAGVNISKYYQIMANWDHPFAKMHLTTDLKIACLGAHNGGQGAIMITGTGSCGYRNTLSQDLLIGGHGFPQGDKCGGAWLGFKAVESVLLAADGLLPKTTLTTAIFAELSCTNIDKLIESIAGQGATYFGRLAMSVLDQADAGDEVAKQIVTEGCEYFTKVYTQLMTPEQLPFAMIGGLGPRLKPWLPVEIQQNIKQALYSPEIGGVLFALKQQAKAIAC